jgi:hypothetical protein
MTYAQAKLIIWNPGAYDRDQVINAAKFILTRLRAQQEDIDCAIRLI